MLGSLALRHGVLYVARHGAGAHVRPYDLDGIPLSPGFAVRAVDGSAPKLAAIDVDPDHHVWIADRLDARIRRFTLFGREVGGFASTATGDARSSFADLVDLRVDERDGELEFLIASGGWRRHAVQRVGEDGHSIASLRSEGDPQANFHGVTRVARSGSRIYVCEMHAARIQVFRDGEFEFSFKLALAGGARFEPAAIAALDDGRMVLATGGEASALHLLDRAGRVERVLAESGAKTGCVLEPCDVVVEQGANERETKLAVIDRDAERVQVFTLEGRCQGALAALSGE